MKFMKKMRSMPSLFCSSSKSRSSSVVRSNPSSFGSSSSSSEPKETPKNVIPRQTSGGWTGSSVEDVHCDFAEVFRSLDKDADGKIPAVELEVVLRRLGSAEEEAAMMVSLADADGDGCVTMEEFCALGGPSGAAELIEAFRAFDTNGDGQISAEELHCMLLALGDDGCTIDDCRKIIRSVDSDGDGFVGFEDFQRMMRQQGLMST